MAAWVVYRARQIALDRTVALKLITPEQAADGAFRERLRRESKLLASIDHANVITVYEAGEAEGQLFMSMRYVEGVDLHSLIAAEGPLAPERAARIVAQVAAGLDAAHERGLVHRDVKPANVLIERRDDAEHAYLSDFGLANQVNLTSAITRGGQWVGTLDYVAPEQIQARRVDARTDVYALGCVLFQALTGRVPYPCDSDAAKLYAHLNGPAPSARQLRPELPVELDRVCARAMAKDPAQRHQSAGDLGRATIAAAGGEAITETADGVAAGAAAGAASPRLPRRRVLLAVAGVSAALLVAAGTAALSGGGDDDAPKNVASSQIAPATSSTVTMPATASDTTPRSATRRRSGDTAAARRAPAPGRAATPPSPTAAGSSGARRPPSPPPASTKRKRPPSTPERKPSEITTIPSVAPPAAAPPLPTASPPAVAAPPPPQPASGVRRAACSDGRDNDGDGKTDFPDDLGCTSATDTAEKAACSDGIDNDDDGKTDFPDDLECVSNDDAAEAT